MNLNIFSLPNEIIQKILEFLEYSDICNVIGTCKFFKIQGENSCVVKNFELVINREKLEDLSNSDIEVLMNMDRLAKLEKLKVYGRLLSEEKIECILSVLRTMDTRNLNQLKFISTSFIKLPPEPLFSVISSIECVVLDFNFIEFEQMNFLFSKVKQGAKAIFRCHSISRIGYPKPNMSQSVRVSKASHQN